MSRVSSIARCLTLASMSSASFHRIRARCEASRPDQRPSSKATRAAAAAREMSAASPRAMFAVVSSVAGFTVAKVSPLAASCQVPSMKSFV